MSVSFSRLATLRLYSREKDRYHSFPNGDNIKYNKNKKNDFSLVCSSSQKLEAEVRLEPKVETLLNSVKWDDKGLAVVIAQNVDTGAILMQGFANREALATTISSRKATFYSRSRSSLWIKGETSTNFINIHDIFLDCDRDSIIYLGKPDGPTCHTGSETCYYSSVNDFLKHPEVKENLALTTVYSLESTISQRKAEIGTSEKEKPSWTQRLLLDKKLLCSKIRMSKWKMFSKFSEKDSSSPALRKRIAEKLMASSTTGYTLQTRGHKLAKAKSFAQNLFKNSEDPTVFWLQFKYCGINAKKKLAVRLKLYNIIADELLLTI
ncbi:hypothetical protein GIB67_003475 [Kingdonia uniflora]|uniref:phosphoribosyl-AMP cyclohydrolase n=1 Tax=Kingdonia uniflora TaxID=39325 RepID=A0A7J7MEG2_9MAGN|nr:hypothetical protein GIB67_003475 [Kingdonia uniflora]